MTNATITTEGTRSMAVLKKDARDSVLESLLASDKAFAAAYAATQAAMLSVTTEFNGVTYTTDAALIEMNRIHMNGLNLRRANQTAYNARTLADEKGSVVRASLESGYIDLAGAMDSANKKKDEADILPGFMAYPVSPDEYEVYSNLKQFLTDNKVARNYLSREVGNAAKAETKSVK
jgi:hypothetical protein